MTDDQARIKHELVQRELDEAIRALCDFHGEAVPDFDRWPYCIYTRVGLGGPLIVKTPKGLAFLWFATEALALEFIAASKIEENSTVIFRGDLGSSRYPIPLEWEEIKDAVFIESNNTLGLFLSDREGFPYAEFIHPVPNR